MLKRCTHICLVLFTIFICTTSVKAEQVWEEVEPGLDMATFALADNVNTHVVALRFSPKFFDFVLRSISEGNNPAQTLMQWAVQHNFVAAINASMYLPDGKTSTGYLRIEKHINNNHIAKNFGAFFLSNPYDNKLAPARVIDKDIKDWQGLIDQYAMVVQNYRLINSKREVLWSAGGQKHSIAAVAEDGAGNILFLHCREPVMAHDFAVALLELPLDVRTVMYVEGGVQAGLVLRSNKQDTLWGGRHPSDIFMGSVSVALPNIIGVLRKQNLPSK